MQLSKTRKQYTLVKKENELFLLSLVVVVFLLRVQHAFQIKTLKNVKW